MYPALAVAAVLAERGHEVTFAGTPEGVEARLASEAGIAFVAVRSAGWDRSRPWTALTGSALMAVSIVAARGVLRTLRPDRVIGFGGYVSIPYGLAAVLAGVPLVLAEQNSVPGVANRLLSRWAAAVALTAQGSERWLRHPERAVLTGNPVRGEIRSASRAAGRAMLGLDDGDLVLLVFGGSRGARHVNEATLREHDALMGVEGLRVVHVAGRGEAAGVRRALDALPARDAERYHVHDYIEDMGAAIAAADLVVARAGATSIAEITSLGRAAVLVPYPYATDDHQTLNARAVEAGGGALVVTDAQLDGEAYMDAVLGLLRDGERRARMERASAALGRPHAASAVAQLAVRVTCSEGEAS